MKSVTVFFVAIVLAFALVTHADAQNPERIWLTANTAAFKTGETVVVTLNASSATPIQGFTFQIRYDPDCLKPVNAVSQVPGMNALPLPQISGVADGSYASTTPQLINGVLAEVRFVTLGGCQTNVTLESAALAVRNESGFAAPVGNVNVAKESLILNIDKALAEAQSPEALSGSVLPLEPPPAPARGIPGWAIVLMSILVVGGVMFLAFRQLRIGTTSPRSPATPPMPTLQIKHGPRAGESFVLNTLPCYIGRDPVNQICLNDPHISSQHAKIYAANNAYYLMDLGGGTFINGQAVKRNPASLKPGDVVRLGKSALFVFAS